MVSYLLQHLGNLDKEVGELGLLGRRAPGHVDLEHVRQQRLRDVQRQPTQEGQQTFSKIQSLILQKGEQTSLCLLITLPSALQS